MNIVVIEDERQILSTICDVLEMDFAGSNIQAFDDLPTESEKDILRSSDIIISDCQLPSGTICNCEYLQEMSNPMIIISGDYGFTCKRDNCRVLHKPFKLSDLTKLVREMTCK